MVTIDCAEQPLQVSVQDRRLVISIGVNTLAFADKERHEDDDKFRVINSDGFAVDVVEQLEKENEIGASMLTNLIDEAMQAARDAGSAHIDHLK